MFLHCGRFLGLRVIGAVLALMSGSLCFAAVAPEIADKQREFLLSHAHFLSQDQQAERVMRTVTDFQGRVMNAGYDQGAKRYIPLTPQGEVRQDMTGMGRDRDFVFFVVTQEGQDAWLPKGVARAVDWCSYVWQRPIRFEACTWHHDGTPDYEMRAALDCTKKLLQVLTEYQKLGLKTPGVLLFAAGETAPIVLRMTAPCLRLFLFHPEPLKLDQFSPKVLSSAGRMYVLYGTGDVGGGTAGSLVQAVKGALVESKERKLGVWARRDPRVRFVRVQHDGSDVVASDVVTSQEIAAQCGAIAYAADLYRDNRDFDANIFVSTNTMRKFPLCALRNIDGLNALDYEDQDPLLAWNKKNEEIFFDLYEKPIEQKATRTEKLLGAQGAKLVAQGAVTAKEYATTAGQYATSAATAATSNILAWWYGNPLTQEKEKQKEAEADDEWVVLSGEKKPEHKPQVETSPVPQMQPVEPEVVIAHAPEQVVEQAQGKEAEKPLVALSAQEELQLLPILQEQKKLAPFLAWYEWVSKLDEGVLAGSFKSQNIHMPTIPLEELKGVMGEAAKLLQPQDQALQGKKSYVVRRTLPQESQIHILGDLHGSIHSLMRVLGDLYKKGVINGDFSLQQGHYLLFLGDFVDRGGYGLECMYTVARLKKASPEQVLITRGNHEDYAVGSMWKRYGFSAELDAKYGQQVGKQIYELMARFSDAMPLALYLGFNSAYVQCCHGGIEPSYDPVPLLNIGDDTAQECKGHAAGFNWSDFVQEVQQNPRAHAQESDRGAGYEVSAAGVERYLAGDKVLLPGKPFSIANNAGNKNRLFGFIRGHQDACKGCKMLWGTTKWVREKSALREKVAKTKAYERYTSGPWDWEVVVSQAQREQGIPFTALGKDGYLPVFTFSNATATQAVDFACYATLKFGQSFADWLIRVHQLPLEPLKPLTVQE